MLLIFFLLYKNEVYSNRNQIALPGHLNMISMQTILKKYFYFYIIWPNIMYFFIVFYQYTANLFLS